MSFSIDMKFAFQLSNITNILLLQSASPPRLPKS